MIVEPLAGAVGLICPPRLAAPAPGVVAEDMLLDAARAWLRKRGAKLMQALLSGGEGEVALPLLRNGFKCITTLLFLQKDLGEEDEANQLPEGLHCERWTRRSHALFCATLLESYEKSLDCPELNNIRTAEEIVEGYKAMPGCRLDHWWLAWVHDRPAGVIISLAEQDEAPWELAYLGLVPAARGQGLGTALTRMALAHARVSGARRMRLTVDIRNTPARQMYQSLGFAQVDSRDVYLSVFDNC
jgi:ribosomal protein S18 acetylase RimI-like enzyme